MSLEWGRICSDEASRVQEKNIEKTQFCVKKNKIDR